MKMTHTKIDFKSRADLRVFAAEDCILYKRHVTMQEVLRRLIAREKAVRSKGR